MTPEQTKPHCATMKDELVEKVAEDLWQEHLRSMGFTSGWWGSADTQPGDTIGVADESEKEYWRSLARAALAAIPQAGDAAELVERLEKKAKHTDATFSNSSLGQLYREAATTIRTLQARLDAETERCAKVAELYQRDVGDGDDTPLLEANRICQVIATAIRERSGHD